MKNRLLLLFLLIATFGYAQNVSIPDANFKVYYVYGTLWDILHNREL